MLRSVGGAGTRGVRPRYPVRQALCRPLVPNGADTESTVHLKRQIARRAIHLVDATRRVGAVPTGKARCSDP